MAPDKKLSVDDILGELALSRAKLEHRAPVGDMQRVDEVIRDILTQKQAEMLKRENRQATEREKAELEREIRSQTKTLTRQFVKLKKELEKQNRVQQKSAPSSVSPKGLEQTQAPERVVPPQVPEVRKADRAPERTVPPQAPEVRKADRAPERAVPPQVPEVRKADRVPERAMPPQVPEVRKADQAPERAVPLQALEKETEDAILSWEIVAPWKKKEPATAQENQGFKGDADTLPTRGTDESALQEATSENPRVRRGRSASALPQAEASTDAPSSLRENTAHIQGGKDKITGHFGNFRMEDTSVEDSYAKTEITLKNYKELRTSRNKKVDSFVLGGAEAAEAPPVEDEAEEELDEAAQVQLDAERHLVQQFDGEEYSSPEQAEEVQANLQALAGRLRTILIILGAIGINACLLSFVTIGPSALTLLGKLALSPLMYAVINLALLVLALAVGHDVFRNVADCLRKKQSCRDIYYLVASLVCLGVNLAVCFQPGKLLTAGVHLYTPVAVLLLFFNFASHYQILAKTLANFKFASGDGEKYAVLQVEELGTAKSMTKGALDTEPVLIKNVKTSFIENFLSRAFASDSSDNTLQKALYFAAPLGTLLFILGWFLTKDIFIGLTMLSGTLVLGGGFVGAVMVSLPLRDSAGVVRRFNGMTPDYSTIEEYRDVNAMLLNGSDLFPADSIRLQSIKTFQGKRIDDVIIDAASVVCAAGSALQNVFLGIINNATKLLRPVDSLQYEDLMGLSAWVNEKRVLIGNRELMINHSILVPKMDFEKQFRDEGFEVTYLATEGELAAAFILVFQPDRTTADVVRMLEKNDVVAVVKTVDACITADLLSAQFDMGPDFFKVLPSRLHREYDEETRPCERAASTLGNNGTLLGYIVSMAITKKLHGCIRLGSLLYWTSAACGIGLLTALLLLGALGSLGALQILLFMGVFLLVYWIYEKNMRL